MTASGFLLGTRRRVNDVGIQIEWDDAALTEPMETTLAYFGFAPPGAAPAVRPLRLTFSMHRSPLEVPREAEALSESHEGLRFHRLGETLYLHFQGTVVRLEPQQGLAYGTLAAEKTGLRDALLFCLFFYSVVILLYYRGLRTMHAACLTQGDAGCLFIGESDSGKSTLAMRLVESGWHYLSDDSVLLSREGGGIEAYPLRRDFCLDPEAEAVFPADRRVLAATPRGRPEAAPRHRIALPRPGGGPVHGSHPRLPPDRGRGREQARPAGSHQGTVRPFAPQRCPRCAGRSHRRRPSRRPQAADCSGAELHAVGRTRPPRRPCGSRQTAQRSGERMND